MRFAAQRAWTMHTSVALQCMTQFCNDSLLMRFGFFSAFGGWLRSSPWTPWASWRISLTCRAHVAEDNLWLWYGAWDGTFVVTCSFPLDFSACACDLPPAKERGSNCCSVTRENDRTGDPCCRDHGGPQGWVASVSAGCEFQVRTLGQASYDESHEGGHHRTGARGLCCKNVDWNGKHERFVGILLQQLQSADWLHDHFESCKFSIEVGLVNAQSILQCCQCQANFASGSWLVAIPDVACRTESNPARAELLFRSECNRLATH